MSTGTALPDPAALVAQALSAHRAGRPAEAGAFYRKALALNPGYGDALHLLGLASLQRGDAAAAGRLVGRALRVNGEAAIYHNTNAEVGRTRGDLGCAAAAARRAVALNPAYAEPHVNLAKLHRQQGHPARALDCGLRAVRLAPDRLDAAQAVAAAIFDQRRYAAALAAWRRVLALKPDDAEGVEHLARTALARGDAVAATAVAARDVRLRPADAEAWRRLGDTLIKRQDAGRADAAYRRALALRPDFAEAFNNLGSALIAARRFTDAKVPYRRALALRPGYPDPWNNLGSALWEVGEGAPARESYQRAVALQPDHPDAYANLGYARRSDARGAADYAAAEVACRRALALAPDHISARNNLGITHLDLGRLAEAEEDFRGVLTRSPENADGHFNLSLALLKAGRWADGWAEYEWRWRTGQLPVPNLRHPLWGGEDLAGRSILLHAEQGHGDTLHFVRYAPLVAARGGRVILAVQKALKRLVAAMPGVAAVYELHEPIPDFDLHCPLLSLPRAFATHEATIPANVPYLHADPADVSAWRARLPHGGGRPRVGLVWSGDPRRHAPRANATDRRRSLTLAAFAPLAAARDAVTFYNLQMGEPAEQLRTPPAGLDLIDLTGGVGDFADTAALIMNLDLVITVDTSVAHLAGALGKPVWVLSRFDGCWRWLTGRDDSPWYPTLRLFRQPSPGEWGSAIHNVAEQLLTFATPAR
ncbi:tetratricopeptide repeat protein [Azospirillum sp.]|uniref:tetratricopeptide repeat protein n=1 Tax=Azospirillum sp. TaxID=34012 RepID=UPI002D62B04D|nr:tetratricopeptide repeat protein [Azospirillum sp.]HYD69489.1 tetratricopeptide repeat protein [Azospirillum sp.]